MSVKEDQRYKDIAEKSMQTAQADEIKLNIGAGNYEMPGYTTIDHESGKEAYPLDYPDESVQDIRASHVLEHFPEREVIKVVEEWVRVLKPGGRLQIAVPDFDYVVRERAKMLGDNGDAAEPMDPLLGSYILGSQRTDDDLHRSIFYYSKLYMLLDASGLESIGAWTSGMKDCASLDVSLNLRGYKPKEPKKKDRNIHAIMSMPRLAFTDNMFSAMDAFVPLGIKFHRHTGAFWGQCLTDGIQEALDDGAEWVITLDYDTIFVREDVITLCKLMDANPKIDAISGTQVKRNSKAVMLSIRDESGKAVEKVDIREFDGELTKVFSSHFGLTILRTSSFKDLKKPWFISEPDPEGAWGEGRWDEDTYFWKNWNQCGNTLYQANEVRLGHMELMITWPTPKFEVRYQSMTDFLKNRRPQEVVGNGEDKTD